MKLLFSCVPVESRGKETQLFQLVLVSNGFKKFHNIVSFDVNNENTLLSSFYYKKQNENSCAGRKPSCKYRTKWVLLLSCGHQHEKLQKLYLRILRNIFSLLHPNLLLIDLPPYMTENK